MQINNDLKTKLKDLFPSRNVNGIIESFSWIIGMINFRTQNKKINLENLIKEIVDNTLILKNNLESLAYFIYKNMGISPFWTLFFFGQKEQQLNSSQKKLYDDFKTRLFIPKLGDFKVPYWKILIEFEWLEYMFELQSASKIENFEMNIKEIFPPNENKSSEKEKPSEIFPTNENKSSEKEKPSEVFGQYCLLKGLLEKEDNEINQLKDLKKMFVKMNNLSFEKQHLPSLICNQSPLSGLIVLILLQKIKEIVESSKITLDKKIKETIECLDGVFAIVEKWKFSSEEYIRFVDLKKDFLIEVIVSAIFYQESVRTQVEIQPLIKEAEFMPCLFENPEIQNILKKRESLKGEMFDESFRFDQQESNEYKNKPQPFSTIIQTKKQLVKTLLDSKFYLNYLESFQGSHKPMNLVNEDARKRLFSVFNNNVASDLLFLLNLTKKDIRNEKGENQENDKLKNLLQVINNRDPNLINNINVVESLLYFSQKNSKIEITTKNLTANKAFNINMKSDRENMRTLFELFTKKDICNFSKN